MDKKYLDKLTALLIGIGYTHTSNIYNDILLYTKAHQEHPYDSVYYSIIGIDPNNKICSLYGLFSNIEFHERNIIYCKSTNIFFVKNVIEFNILVKRLDEKFNNVIRKYKLNKLLNE